VIILLVGRNHAYEIMLPLSASLCYPFQPLNQMTDITKMSSFSEVRNNIIGNF
jgi:hypothetical protein